MRPQGFAVSKMNRNATGACRIQGAGCFMTEHFRLRPRAFLRRVSFGDSQSPAAHRLILSRERPAPFCRFFFAAPFIFQMMIAPRSLAAQYEESSTGRDISRYRFGEEEMVPWKGSYDPTGNACRKIHPNEDCSPSGRKGTIRVQCSRPGGGNDETFCVESDCSSISCHGSRTSRRAKSSE